jgi:hypothetical protein
MGKAGVIFSDPVCAPAKSFAPVLCSEFGSEAGGVCGVLARALFDFFLGTIFLAGVRMLYAAPCQ